MAIADIYCDCMKLLFFELIQVAIGRRERLSHTPTEMEWRELYALAEKQAVIGICFCGVQRLQRLGYDIPMDLYMKWLGMAAKIQQRNELMNRRCVEAQRMLTEEGMKSCILKGQGVARYYKLKDESLELRANSLGMLRQSGDIDVWVDGGMEKALRWCREKYGDVEYDYINAHVPMFKDVGVELHWRVQSMTNLFRNLRLQRWLEREETKEMIFGGKADMKPSESLQSSETSITVPSLEFNAFYLMLHCYNHEFSSGLGLRQLMDYYFLLRNLNLSSNVNLNNLSADVRQMSDRGFCLDVNELFHKFGMERFVGAVMWIMQEVFGLERERLLCEPNEKEGRYILAEVMAGGNFGHHDERIRKVGKGKWQSVFATLQHAMHVLRRYPTEALWMPVWMAYHFIWKRTLIKF